MFKLRLCKDKLGIKDTYCMSDMIFTFLYVPSIFIDYLNRIALGHGSGAG